MKLRDQLRTITLISALFCCFAPFTLGQQNPAGPTIDGTSWRDIRALKLEGKAWETTKHIYDRLPRSAEGVVREPVWKLGQNSAGLSVRFVTDANKISARWTLRNSSLALPHMPATGVSGLDLYAKIDGKWHWLAIGRPEKYPTNTQVLVSNLPAGEREYLLYLPLYNGVDSVEIGVPEGSTVRPPNLDTTRRLKPVVFYGTSIVQGASASRPGIAYPSILARRLEQPVINLGFSGNGKMEPEMATLLAGLDPAIYVIDCLPNLDPSEVIDRTRNLVRTIRAAHPRTPIVLVENIIYQDGVLEQYKRERYMAKNAALRSVFHELTGQGIKQLSYIPAGRLLGHDGEATVDGTHPNDLGFMRMADAIEPTLRALLRTSHAAVKNQRLPKASH